MERNWITSVGASFAGSYGISSAIISGFDIKRWEFLLFSFATACLIALLHLLFLYKTKQKMQKFFGLTDHSPVNIAIASYWNINEYNESLGDDNNMRYYKHDGISGEKRYLLGAVEYPLTDVGVASLAIQLATNIANAGSRRINLFGDENIPAAVDGPIFCLGSPTSNSTTFLLFSRLPLGFQLDFTTKTLRCWVHDDEYRSSQTIDFGVLLRYTLEARVYFVCAGIDEHGTIALSKLLLEEWKSLPQCDFIHIYKIEKERSRVIDKLSGKRLVGPNLWRTE